MRVGELPLSDSLTELGTSMYRFMDEVFPICRSITGDGLREMLRRIGKIVPLELTEVPSGTKVLDWTVPKEWNIRDAWVADASGARVIDFQRSNLHVLHYSVPVRTHLSLDELRPHLHTLPDHPTWIPYHTSYYAEKWGFCLSQEALDRLPPGEYEAVIDATLEDGSLTYGECVLPGETDEEIVVSSHVCHPSLANDNLSAVAVATFLAQTLLGAERRYTYRFVFAPGTIGAITWLAMNRDRVDRIRAGLVLSCVGDASPLVYKRTRRGDTEIDRAMAHVLGQRRGMDELVDFAPFGNDERQYCSPGFDLPVGSVTRSGFGRFERHHTSADDLATIDPASLADAAHACLRVFGVLEHNAVPVSLSPYGEPQLGRRGLYRDLGGRANQAELEAALLWVLNLADGVTTLLDIAERSGLAFEVVHEAADALVAAELLSLGQP